jgi:hypothetical protein
MTDFLTQKRAEIEQRLEELRPLRDEYTRLERAKAALEGAAGGATGRPRGRSTSGSGSRLRSTSSGNGRRRRSGGRAGEALDLVRRNPGITISEMGERLGMRQHNYLYRIMAALQSEGAVEKQGRGFVAR